MHLVLKPGRAHGVPGLLAERGRFELPRVMFAMLTERLLTLLLAALQATPLSHLGTSPSVYFVFKKPHRPSQKGRCHIDSAPYGACGVNLHTSAQERYGF